MSSNLLNIKGVKNYSGWYIGDLLIHLNCARKQKISLFLIVSVWCELEQLWDGVGGVLLIR